MTLSFVQCSGSVFICLFFLDAIKLEKDKHFFELILIPAFQNVFVPTLVYVGSKLWT